MVQKRSLSILLSEILPIKFGETVGLVVHFDQGEPMSHLGNLKELGVKWVRESQSWYTIEPKAGEYQLPEHFKRRLKFYKENDIDVIYTLCYDNPRAYPDEPYNAEAYGRYAVEAAKLLKKVGVNFVLELWNEPHNFGLMKHYGGKWNGAPPSPWVVHYVRMVREAVKQVKAYDSAIKVISDEDVVVTHYWFLEAGLPKELDGFAIHPYVHGGGSPGPEVTHFGPEADWAKPFTIIDEDMSFRSVVRRLKRQYAEKLGHPAEVYVTEWGYGLGSTAYKEEKVTEELACAYLPRLYIASVAAGAQVVCWHCSQDIGDGPYGLFRNDQTKRKTYDVFRVMTEQLGDYRLVKHLVGADKTTKGIQAYLFEGDAGYKLVAWCIDGPVEMALASASNAPLQIFDHFGKGVPISHAYDGLPILKLDKAPIYIEGIGEYCSLEP